MNFVSEGVVPTYKNVGVSRGETICAADGSSMGISMLHPPSECFWSCAGEGSMFERCTLAARNMHWATFSRSSSSLSAADGAAVATPLNDLDGQHISRDQQVGHRCHSEWDPAICCLDDPWYVSKCNQEAVQKRCLSGAEELCGPECLFPAWQHYLRSVHLLSISDGSSVRAVISGVTDAVV